MRTDAQRIADAARRELFEGVDWGKTYANLVSFARSRLKRLGLEEMARDFAQDAIKRALDSDYKAWDPAQETLRMHLGSVVNGLIREYIDRHATKNEKLAVDDDVAADSSRAPAVPRALEDQTAERQMGAAVFARLRERFRDDPLETALLELSAADVEPQEQAERLGISPTEVYRARRRIHRNATDVMAELEKKS